MLLGSFARKTAVDLGRNTHHEPGRIAALRQGLWDWLAGSSQVGEDVTHDIGETFECFNPRPDHYGGRQHKTAARPCGPLKPRIGLLHRVLGNNVLSNYSIAAFEDLCWLQRRVLA